MPEVMVELQLLNLIQPARMRYNQTMKKKGFRIASSNVQFALPMIFTLIIGLITAVDLFYWEQSFTQMRLWQILVLFISFIAMMLLDMVDMLVFPRRMPEAIQSFLFILRLALIALIQFLDITSSSASILGLIPYYTFFAYGGVISVLFTLLLAGFLYTRIELIGSSITLAMANLLFMQILSFIMVHSHNITLRNRELLEELHRTNTELQLVADEVAELSAVEERMRLSRDLHDSIGHHLTAISIQLEKAVAYLEISEEDAVEAVNNARTSAGEALQEVRLFISTLKEKQMTFSYAEKSQVLIEGLEQDNLTITSKIEGDEELYPQHVRRNLYHTLQELLTNIQKHAQATEIDIQTRFGKREASLKVSDNGIGFAPKRALRKDGHFGLKHLQERTTQIDGILSIESNKNKGTKAEIKVPRKR